MSDEAEAEVEEIEIDLENQTVLTAEEINDLIEQHVPLVKHIVFQVAVHFPRHVEREELARAGALGLVEAAQRYSPDRGIPFQRFAARRVRGAMLDAVRAADWAPRSVRRLSRRFDAMEQQLASQLGRAPSTSETAEALGMNPNELSKLRSQLYRSVVLALEARGRWRERRRAEPARHENADTGRRAQRRKAYANAIGGASDWRDRLDEGAELSTRIRSVL
ncbi:RNA polymerase sigma factor WhiG [Nymphon striatum]|nr:RNA polymerase sigma factor WhiG [Nymphon striatum]